MMEITLERAKVGIWKITTGLVIYSLLSMKQQNCRLLLCFSQIT